MNKILNWTFGACFRTLGRFLAIFIVGVLLIFIGSKIGIELPSFLAIRVNAAMEGFGWYDKNVKNVILSSRFVDWTSSTNYTLLDSSATFITQDKTASTLQDRNKLIVGKNGVSYQIYLDESLKIDYLYSVQLYVCTDSTYNDNFNNFQLNLKTGIDPNQSLTNIPNFQFATISEASTLYGYDGDPWFKEFTWCGIYNSLISPSVNGSWYEIQAKSPNINVNFNPYLMGYTIEELGIYNNSLKTYIENAINTSGFATAESVEQVNQSVNVLKEEVIELNNAQQETNDTIKDSDTSGAEDSASGFFNDFTTETFGLTSIITAPLNAINSLINSSCNNLVLPLPFVEKNLTLPCMNSIYSNYFKGFFDLYQIITTGLISYYVIVRIFNLVKDFKNPEHDEIEVMDL